MYFIKPIQQNFLVQQRYFNIAFILINIGNGLIAYPARVPIQTFTMPENSAEGLLSTFNFTLKRLNSAPQSAFDLTHKNRELKAGDSGTWNIISNICVELQQGFMMMLIGGNNLRQHEAYYSISSALEIPLINWELSPVAKKMLSQHSFEVSVQCPNAELIADLIVQKKWGHFVYLHDVENADRASKNLHQIYSHLRKISNISITSELVELPENVIEFSDFLTQFHLKRFFEHSFSRIILDTLSNYRQQKLLQTIREAQFNQGKYHYVVANFDFLPFDIEKFGNSNINITGFQIIDRETHNYILLKRHIVQEGHIKDSFDLQAKLGFVHDALIIAKSAFKLALRQNDSAFHNNFRHGKFYNYNYPGIYCNPANDRNNKDRSFSTFEHGKMIAKAMNSVKLSSFENNTLTGNIEFDENGIRKNFIVTVIDLVSDAKSAFNKKEFLTWRQGIGFVTNRTVAQHTRRTMDLNTKDVIKVVSILVEPFVMIKRDCEGVNSSQCQGNKRFEGFCIDLLKFLSELIEDFNYEIFITNKYGTKQPDGSWDGLIGHLLRGEANVSVASLTINQDRERVVDFSKPYMTTGISIMIKKPDKQDFSVFSFLEPLSSDIWMYIIFSYIGVSIVIFLVSRFSPYEWRVEEMANGGFTISNDFSVYNCLWFTLAAFMQQGTDILPRSISGRIASSAWWFFTMIIVSSYTANLAAFLTLEKMQAPIENVEDLATQTKIKYGIQQGGSTAQFFKYSSIEVYRRMWRFMESQVPSVFTSSYAEGIELVRSHKGRYAFLLEATANDYANTRLPCDTMKVGANLNSVGYGVSTPFGSKWKDHINLAILALQERGELKKLENKWWFDRAQCKHGIEQDGSSASLKLSKVSGIFFILTGGMIASMIAAIVEFIYRSRIEARKGQITSMQSLRASFCGQLKLSLQGSAVVKEGNSAHKELKKLKVASQLQADYNDLAISINSVVVPSSTNILNFATNSNEREYNNNDEGKTKPFNSTIHQKPATSILSSNVKQTFSNLQNGACQEQEQFHKILNKSYNTVV